jgi:hypothetical protein
MTMNRNYLKSFGLLAFVACTQAATAQSIFDGGSFWDTACWPPPPTSGVWRGFSDTYGIVPLDDELFGVVVGVSGTDTWGACLTIAADTFAFNMGGRIGFSVGALGSVQTDADDYLRLTYGAPYGTGGAMGYAMLVTQPVAAGSGITKTLIDGWDTIYQGASDRYNVFATTKAGTRVRLQTDIIGDSVRLNWKLTNQGTAANKVGLWFGQYVELLDKDASGNYGPGASASDFITYPGARPMRLGQTFSTTPGTVLEGTDLPSLTMPPYVNFGWNQEKAYGLQIVNYARTVNGEAESDQTPIDELRVGHADLGGPDSGLLGLPENNSPTFPGTMLQESIFADYQNPNVYHDTGYLQKWNPSTVQANETREINAYYRSLWGVSNYAKPFTAVVDAPHLIATASDDVNNFTPNPFTIRVYMDNTRGYSTIDQEIPIENARIELDLPPGFTDVNDATKTQIVKRIPLINPRTMKYVDFQVRIDPTVYGFQPYTVKISTATGANKTLTGTINVATTPRLRLATAANLITSPWTYSNTSWETILGLQVDQDFQAFTYDAQQNEYVIQTGPQRGKGTWIINNLAQSTYTLQGSPSEPTDLTTGSPLIQLQPGWNLIGNPYNFSIQLGQMIGVDSSNPSQSYTFPDLVSQGIIAPALAYYDAESLTPEYRYIQDNADYLVPNRGYWLFVNGAKYITLRFPPVLEPFLPARAETGWTQSDKQWRLQLAARNDQTVDSQNFVGVAKSAKDAKILRLSKPPVVPVKGAVSLSISQNVNGQATKLAQSLADAPGRLSWNIDVYSKQAGNVTVTWPNLNSVPKNYQFRLVDLATGATRNLRRASGYTFSAEERATRSFRLEAQPGSADRAMIGSILATRSDRSANSPLAISYTLASDATTTIRILRGGQEVYVATRARADRAGENTVIWNLRDSANRAVAPGAYSVELTAESTTGDRVRKIYPVNIVR